METDPANSKHYLNILSKLSKDLLTQLKNTFQFKSHETFTVWNLCVNALARIPSNIMEAIEKIEEEIKAKGQENARLDDLALMPEAELLFNLVKHRSFLKGSSKPDSLDIFLEIFLDRGTFSTRFMNFCNDLKNKKPSTDEEWVDVLTAMFWVQKCNLRIVKDGQVLQSLEKFPDRPGSFIFLGKDPV